MRDRGQQRRSQPVGLDRALDAIHVLDQMHALDRERALVDQRVEQSPLIRREQRARLVAVDADDADRAASGAHRQEQALGAGQRIGPPPGGAVVGPCPFRGGEIGLVENVLGRVAGLHGDRAILGQQQHDADLEHQRGLIGGRPQDIIERADAGELAAEGVKQFGAARPPDRGDGLRAHARGHVGNDDRHDDEEEERRHIGRVGDRERVDRRQEEEVVAERSDRRWRTATATSHSARRRRPRR